MRKIVIAGMGTLSVLVLVVSFDASLRGGGATTAADGGSSTDTSESTDTGEGGGDGSSPTGGDDAGTPSASTSSDSGDSSSASSSKAKVASGSFTGGEVQTRWGIVQVKITVKNGKITKAKALQYPQENHHDQEINSWAVPQLQQMTVDNQGRIDSLSGATVTSDGYRQSLQSALDKADL